MMLQQDNIEGQIVQWLEEDISKSGRSSELAASYCAFRFHTTTDVVHGIFRRIKKTSIEEYIRNIKPKVDTFDHELIQYIVQDICFKAEFVWSTSFYPGYTDDINATVLACSQKFYTTQSYIRDIFTRRKRLTIEDYAAKQMGHPIAPYVQKFDQTIKERNPDTGRYVVRSSKPLIITKSVKELAWDKLNILVKQAKEGIR